MVSETMKKVITLLIISLSPIIGQDDAPDLEQYIGDWQGEGRFYNVNLSTEVGVVRFTLRVTPDLEISGTIGAAEIIDGQLEVDDWNDGYKIRAQVSGRIFPGHDFDKRRLTLLLKKVEEDRTVGDFHLANNFIFDFSMRPGEITLSRNP